MKRIIAGLRYDTDTAECLGRDRQCNGSFSDWDEALYKTRNGRYFLAGDGGPASRWAKPSGDHGRMGGSDIVPMTPEEARTWAEQHLDPDIVEAHFPIEDA